MVNWRNFPHEEYAFLYNGRVGFTADMSELTGLSQAGQQKVEEIIVNVEYASRRQYELITAALEKQIAYLEEMEKEYPNATTGWTWLKETQALMKRHLSNRRPQ